MILLTDEEMKALRPDVPACGQTVFGCDSCSGGCPVVAKAQLKKVVEWAEDHYWDTLAKDRDLIILHIKQALLEEVKDTIEPIRE